MDSIAFLGERLKNRLYSDVKKAQLAYGSIKQLRFLVDELGVGVEWLVENFSLEADPVLGHGDFQPVNLLVLALSFNKVSNEGIITYFIE